MDKNIISPFTVSLDIPDAWKIDLAYKQTIGFLAATYVTRTLVNIQRQKLCERDFEIRDILFKNKFHIQDQDDIYDYAQEHFKMSKTHDQATNLMTLRENCQVKKFDFWRKYSKIQPISNEKLETKQIINEAYKSLLIQQIKRHETFIAQAYFLAPAAAMFVVLKLRHNPFRFTVLLVGSSLLMGYYFSIFRSFIYISIPQLDSNRIFDNIPKLPDLEAEKERQQIINYCFTLDLGYQIILILLNQAGLQVPTL